MANNCLSEPLWRFWFSQGQENNRWGLSMAPAICSEGHSKRRGQRIHLSAWVTWPLGTPWWAETHTSVKAHTHTHSFSGHRSAADSPWGQASQTFQKVCKEQTDFLSQKSQIVSFSTQFCSHEHRPIYCSTCLLPAPAETPSPCVWISVYLRTSKLSLHSRTASRA